MQKFHHNFECLTPICNCGAANENNEHYPALPPLQSIARRSSGTVTEVLGIDIANLDSETLYNLLLYGSLNMTMIDNRIIIEAKIEYIEKQTG